MMRFPKIRDAFKGDCRGGDIGLCRGRFLGSRFPNTRYLVEGPYDQDYSILGSMLGSPDFGKLPRQEGQS